MEVSHYWYISERTCYRWLNMYLASDTTIGTYQLEFVIIWQYLALDTTTGTYMYQIELATDGSISSQTQLPVHVSQNLLQMAVSRLGHNYRYMSVRTCFRWQYHVSSTTTGTCQLELALDGSIFPQTQLPVHIRKNLLQMKSSRLRHNYRYISVRTCFRWQYLVSDTTTGTCQLELAIDDSISRQTQLSVHISQNLPQMAVSLLRHNYRYISVRTCYR